MARSHVKQHDGPLTLRDLQRMLGDIEADKITEILAIEPTVEDVEIALAWGASESDVMGEERLPLTGRAAQVYEVIYGDTEFEDDR